MLVSGSARQMHGAELDPPVKVERTKPARRTSLMSAYARPSARHWVVWGMVVGGHLCALGVVLYQRPGRPEPYDQEPLRVVLLPLSAIAEPFPPASIPKSRRKIDAPNAQALVSPLNPVAPAPMTAPSTPPTDWEREGAISAEANAHAPPPERTCDDAELPDPWRPKCKKAPRASPWEPELPRVGVQGLIPYAQLGEHCVVGLGFFGCSLGTRPPNGHLFDEMKSPDRLRSSVPDASN